MTDVKTCFLVLVYSKYIPQVFKTCKKSFYLYIVFVRPPPLTKTPLFCLLIIDTFVGPHPTIWTPSHTHTHTHAHLLDTEKYVFQN